MKQLSMREECFRQFGGPGGKRCAARTVNRLETSRAVSEDVSSVGCSIAAARALTAGAAGLLPFGAERRALKRRK